MKCLKNQKNNSENQKSTVFCNPKILHESTKPKKDKKKIALIIVSAFVAVFVVIPIIIVFVANMVKDTNTHKPVPPFSSRLENTTADEFALNLYEKRVDSVTDSEQVAELVDLLEISDNCGTFSLEAKIESKPYKLYFNFPTSNDASIKEEFEMQMVKCSCVLLALIDDIDEVGWTYPADETGDTGSFFTRADATKLLGKIPVSYYSVSANGIQLLLTELGLEG